MYTYEYCVIQYKVWYDHMMYQISRSNRACISQYEGMSVCVVYSTDRRITHSTSVMHVATTTGNFSAHRPSIANYLYSTVCTVPKVEKIDRQRQHSTKEQQPLTLPIPTTTIIIIITLPSQTHTCLYRINVHSALNQKIWKMCPFVWTCD